MRLLLDSHIVVWLDREPDLVRAEWREVLRNPESELFVSAVTVWELGIKRAKGQIVFAGSVIGLAARLGLRELPITMRHGEVAAELKWSHKDPFDRMLVAQAQAECMTLVTVDRDVREWFADLFVTLT